MNAELQPEHEPVSEERAQQAVQSKKGHHLIDAVQAINWNLSLIHI